MTTFTLETWFKRTGAGVGVSTGTGGIASAIPLITKGGAEAETPANVNMNYFLGIDATSGKLVADFEEPAGPNHPVSGTAVVTSNVWHHAAATYDATNGTWKLYLDGNLDTTLALGSAFQPQSASIQHAALGTSLTSTGTIAQPPGGFFAGVLDEARIWNVARSDAQIATNFNKTLTAGAGLSPAMASTRARARRRPRASPGLPTGTLTNGPLWTAGPPLTPAGNSAPVFSTDFADRTDAEGDTPTGLDADATDIDGDTLTYSATGLPGGLAINSATGLISGTLSFSSAGVYNTVITVSDGSLTATDTFTWTVTNVNRPPVFSTDFGDRTDAEGDTPTGLDANATDPDGDTLTYGATGLPSGLSISPTTGLISGTLELDQLGQLQHRHHRLRRQPDRHRHVHLDGHQRQPATGLQHRLRRPHRRRGRHADRPRRQCHRSRRRHAHLRRDGLAIGTVDQPDHRPDQRHAQLDQLGQLQHGHHRFRRQPDRHRHVHLDGHQRQPATGLQHRLRRSHRRRGRHADRPRCQCHRSRRRHAHLRRDGLAIGTVDQPDHRPDQRHARARPARAATTRSSPCPTAA